MILIIDGQGGGIGKTLTAKIRETLPEEKLVAVGANYSATAAMLKAGACAAATGENAVAYNAAKADIIAGPVGIISANAMFGEISPMMALAVSKSEAVKVLIPVHKSDIIIAGLEDKVMAQYLDDAVAKIQGILQTN